MLYIAACTRGIIGFAVQAGDVGGVVLCLSSARTLLHSDAVPLPTVAAAPMGTGDAVSSRVCRLQVSRHSPYLLIIGARRGI